MEHLVPDTVWCVYPVSGLYTQFQRILYWVVILVLIFFQFPPWLTKGTLAFAASYSTIACVHALVVGFKSNSVYDADLVVLQVVIQAAIFGAILCLLFSPRILNDSIRTCFFWWCILGLMARSTMQSAGASSIMNVDYKVVKVDYASAMMGGPGDPCANLDVVTVLRGGKSDSLVPAIWTESMNANLTNTTFLDSWARQAPVKSEEGYDYSTNIWLWYLCAGPLFHIILLNGDMRPRDARDHIFRRLRKKWVPRKNVNLALCILLDCLVTMRYVYVWLRFLDPELYGWEVFVRLVLRGLKGLVWFCRCVRWKLWQSRYPRRTARHPRFYGYHDWLVLRQSDSRLRKGFAQAIAAMWYFTAYLLCLAFLAILLYLVIRAETSITWVPESEPKKSVGQWSTWAILGLGLMATLLMQLLHPDPRSRRLIILHHSDLESAEPLAVAKHAKQSAETGKHLFRYLLAYANYEWQDFKNWMRDPERASSHEDNAKKHDVEDFDFDPWSRMELKHDEDRRAVVKEFHLVPKRETDTEPFDYEEDEKLQTFLSSEEYAFWVYELAKRENELNQHPARADGKPGP